MKTHPIAPSKDTQPKPGSRFARRAATSLVVALVVGSLAAIGRATDPYGSGEADGASATPALVVAVEAAVRREGYETQREFVGMVEARRESRVGFELGGQVAAVLFDDGDRVESGAVIARLDTAILEAERQMLVAALDQAQAEVELAAITRDRIATALETNAVSAQQWSETDKNHAARVAALARAEAGLAAVDARLGKAELRAPFAALVAERLVDEGEVVGAGRDVFHLLESVEPEVRIGVAGDSIDEIEVGARFEVSIRGRLESASVRSILPVRGNGTRSVKVILTLDAEFDKIRKGDLATLAIPRAVPGAGYWLPLTALTESSRGLWASFVAESLDAPTVEPMGDAQIKDATHRLSRRELEVVHQEIDRVYVRGTLAHGELVVTEGLQRLVPGQLVRLASPDAFSPDAIAPDALSSRGADS